MCKFLVFGSYFNMYVEKVSKSHVKIVVTFHYKTPL